MIHLRSRYEILYGKRKRKRLFILLPARVWAKAGAASCLSLNRKQGKGKKWERERLSNLQLKSLRLPFSISKQKYHSLSLCNVFSAQGEEKSIVESKDEQKEVWIWLKRWDDMRWGKAREKSQRNTIHQRQEWWRNGLGFHKKKSVWLSPVLVK